MDQFLSCDWGTSSFRLRLVKAENAATVAVRQSERGIAATFSSLDEGTKHDPEERRRFYLRLIQGYIRELEQEQGISLEGVPLVLSGMASSSIGMATLPYSALPFSVDGADLGAAYFQPSPDFAHPVLLISGVKSEADVMRGEETQLIGAISPGAAANDGIYIFPGTHSKHIRVQGRQATGFKTYMTGELFKLLAEESILWEGVEKNDELQSPACLQRFKDGVRDAQEATLLHTVFRVRTNHLFGRGTKKENFHYLSGLLIGAELGALNPSGKLPVYICSDAKLRFRYETALGVLGLRERAHVFPAAWAEEAVVRGQLKIYTHYTRNA